VSALFQSDLISLIPAGDLVLLKLIEGVHGFAKQVVFAPISAVAHAGFYTLFKIGRELVTHTPILRHLLRKVSKAFARLMKFNHLNRGLLAAAIHVGQAKVSRALALIDLPPKVQEQVEKCEPSARAAYQVSTLGYEAAEQQLAATAATQKLTSEAIAKAARQRRGAPKQRVNTSRCIFSYPSAGYTCGLLYVGLVILSRLRC
jgi:hypothetical protein